MSCNWIPTKVDYFHECLLTQFWLFTLNISVCAATEHQGNRYPAARVLQWRHNEHDGVSSHQPQDCLLNCLFRRRSKKASKLRVTGLCKGNSPMTGEFPAQRAINAENISIWLRPHGLLLHAIITVSRRAPDIWISSTIFQRITQTVVVIIRL